jgi:hypothetical protein
MHSDTDKDVENDRNNEKKRKIENAETKSNVKKMIITM